MWGGGTPPHQGKVWERASPHPQKKTQTFRLTWRVSVHSERYFSLFSPEKMSNFSLKKFVRREIGEIVRYLPDQKNLRPLKLLHRSRPKICQGQLPTMCSECSRFQPNRLTFGGVIAERVNTLFLPRRVFPL